MGKKVTVDFSKVSSPDTGLRKSKDHMENEKLFCMVDPNILTEKPGKDAQGGKERRSIVKRMEYKEFKSVKSLIECYASGHTIRPGVLVDGTSAKHWARQKVYMLDFDNREKDPALLDKILERLKLHNLPPAAICKSPSWTKKLPKYRVIFVFDRAVTESSNMKDINSSFKDKFATLDSDAKADGQCFGLQSWFLFGKGIVYRDYDARISARRILSEYKKHTETAKSRNKIVNRDGKLKSAKEEFDLYAYVSENFPESQDIFHESGSIEDGNYCVGLNKCPLCGHQNDFYLYYSNDRGWTFSCYSDSLSSVTGRCAGDAIDFIMIKDNLTPKDSIQEFKSMVGIESPRFFDLEKGFFLHDEMAKYLIDDMHVCKIDGNIHAYQDGVYVFGRDAIFGRMLELASCLTEKQRKEVYAYLRDSNDTPVKELSPPHLIPFKSKVYDLEKDKFVDYSPDHVFKNKIYHDYNPDASPQPKIRKVINDILNNDKELIRVFYEAVGNCFYRENMYRGAVALKGSRGSNGKSTLMNIISSIFMSSNTNVKNVSRLSMIDMSMKFRVLDLYGKLVNLGDDISRNTVFDTENFKKAVTGEAMNGERKGQDVITFVPYAKIFFSCNELPKSLDTSEAFLSRLIILPLDVYFGDSNKKDAKLKERKWSDEEIEYVVCRAMKGLRRIIRNNDFTIPKISRVLVAKYKDDTNTVSAFLKDESIKLYHAMPIPPLYIKYREWCENNGYNKYFTSTKFTTEALIFYKNKFVSRPLRPKGPDGKKIKLGDREKCRCFAINKNN